MKLRISNCPECKKDTLQAKAEVPIGYNFSSTVWKKAWFCSICSKYWDDETNTTRTEIKHVNGNPLPSP